MCQIAWASASFRSYVALLGPCLKTDARSQMFACWDLAGWPCLNSGRSTRSLHGVDDAWVLPSLLL
jgi:hypothetical protein